MTASRISRTQRDGRRGSRPVPQDVGGTSRCAGRCRSLGVLGGFTDLVETALKENVEQARLRADAKLAVARDEFARRFAEVDETTKKAVLTAIEASYTTEYELQPLECPACGTMALASGTLQEEWGEPDWDYGDDGEQPYVVGVPFSVLFIPNGLLCNACHLDLNGRDEMDAAGIGESWYLDDVDVRDFHGDYSDVL